MYQCILLFPNPLLLAFYLFPFTFFLLPFSFILLPLSFYLYSSIFYLPQLDTYENIN